MTKFEPNHRMVFLLLLIFPSVYLYFIQNSDLFREFLYYILKRDKLINLIWISPLLCNAFLSLCFISDEIQERFEHFHGVGAGVISLFLHIAIALMIYEFFRPEYNEADKDLRHVFLFIISLSMPYLFYMIYELFKIKRG